MNWIRLLSNARGITLVEVMISVSLLAVVAASLLGMFLAGAGGYERSGRDTEALNLAKAKMENYIAAGYSEVISLPDANSSWQPYPGSSDYEYEIVVTEYDPELEIRQVTVKVRQIYRPSKEVKLATLVARWP